MILTEENGWAIVWMNDRYYLRHLACGAYFRLGHIVGCLCISLLTSPRRRAHHHARISTIDPLIAAKFKLLTKDEK